MSRQFWIIPILSVCINTWLSGRGKKGDGPFRNNIAQGCIQLILYIIKKVLGKLFAWEVYGEWEILEQFSRFLLARKSTKSFLSTPVANEPLLKEVSGPFVFTYRQDCHLHSLPFALLLWKPLTEPQTMMLLFRFILDILLPAQGSLIKNLLRR